MKAMLRALALSLTMFVAACGGGFTPAPLSNTPQTGNTVADVSQAYDNASHVKTRVFSGVKDEVQIPDGTEIALKEGEARVFFAKHYAKLLQPTLPVRYLEEEITEVQGMRTIVAFKGLDNSNLGVTGELKFDTGLIVISADDLPKGGRYELSFKGAISPDALKSFVNARIEEARQSFVGPLPNNGNGGNDDAGWFAGGVGLGLLIGLGLCPTDAAGIIITRAPGSGDTPSPIASYLASATVTPASASGLVGVTKQFTGECFDQFGKELGGLSHQWTSSDESIATVDNHGLATITGVGTITITFSCTGGGRTVHDTATITGVAPVIEPELTKLDLNPPMATLYSGDTQQFIADALDQNNSPVNGTCVFSIVSGLGQINATSGLYTAPATISANSTTEVKVVCTYKGKSLEDTATITLVADQPGGPTWGGDPFDPSKVRLDVTPEVVTLIFSDDETQQHFADLYYNNVLRISGVGGKYFDIVMTTNAPAGSLSPDGLFDSTVSGLGTWTVTITATLQTLPTPYVKTKTATVTVN